MFKEGAIEEVKYIHDYVLGILNIELISWRIQFFDRINKILFSIFIEPYLNTVILGMSEIKVENGKANLVKLLILICIGLASQISRFVRVIYS